MVVYAGVFETEDKAKAAFDKLVDGGFEADNLFMITPAAGPAKVKEVTALGRNTEFRGMLNRLCAAVSAGRTVLGARPSLFYARLIEPAFNEVGVLKMLEHSDSTPRFFSQVLGIPKLIIPGGPRVTLWRRPVTEMLGKTMIYKRPVTEKLGKRMLLASKPITAGLGKTMLFESKPLTARLGKTMLFASKPLTARLGKKMLFKSKPLTERLGKTMVYSEINKRR